MRVDFPLAYGLSFLFRPHATVRGTARAARSCQRCNLGGASHLSRSASPAPLRPSVPAPDLAEPAGSTTALIRATDSDTEKADGTQILSRAVAPDHVASRANTRAIRGASAPCCLAADRER
jgi:hypothetical protein